MTITINTPKITRTRYKELNLTNVGRNLWRFIATETGSLVGPFYHTKIEALADLDRYAQEYGCEI